jgi:hypothetical protein
MRVAIVDAGLGYLGLFFCRMSLVVCHDYNLASIMIA